MSKGSIHFLREIKKITKSRKWGFGPCEIYLGLLIGAFQSGAALFPKRLGDGASSPGVGWSKQ